ncbi:hypothetical protein BOX15_Mlig014391g3 [Macrostomum lignano]|uniref:Uncharacterized protein n=1 Tax=Macrostomum lignano TaxID=282301 RepID=A0A267E3Q9_9PLAT|nr:hypothetical protein BOX15_Mlig014391g3 [Macrostomum lignano]
MSKACQLLLAVSCCVAACLLTDSRADGFIVSSPSGNSNGGHRYQRPRKSFEQPAAAAECKAARFGQLVAEFRTVREAYLSLLAELTACTEELRYKLVAAPPGSSNMD